MLIAVAADDCEPALMWCFAALWPGDGAIGEASDLIAPLHTGTYTWKDGFTAPQ